ncbi:MAG: hypothetical protein A2Y15_09585 [Clostridiales bacterium GWF2_36_10]|nr:MAG: hypothetical protein A2Y15_09585 [Clostridiales bacterium GWF2_36_10]HAN21561.1 hypothetical protein [Clostridiales bacterium]
MNKNNWQWYGVKIIKEIIVVDEPDKNLIDEFYEEDDKHHYEESLLLIKAPSFDHAYKIAEKATKKDNDFYPNIYGQQVAWKFIKAVDCFLILDKLKSSAEVYSCFHTSDKDTSTDEFLNTRFKSSDEGCRKARHL